MADILPGTLSRKNNYLSINNITAMNDFIKYIDINPDIRFGKPCIKGTRIAVVDILQWLASGMTNEEIMEDFPSIKVEHIRAALSFSAHRESITRITAA